MLASISASVGLRLLLRKAATAIICPDWQYPHCGTPSASQACGTGCLLSGDRPSIVVTSAPATPLIGTLQERTGSPLTCTVQAPQAAIPQPYLVPVNPSSSRSTHNSGASSS